MGSFLFRQTTQPEEGQPRHTLEADRFTVQGDFADQWASWGPCSARVINDGYGPEATLVCSPAGLAAGLVRLDNRRHISHLAQCSEAETDLAIVVAALSRLGESCIRELVGDFAFVFWDAKHRALIAARDALGIRLLYRAEDAEQRSFSSHASLLDADRPWSLEYIADFLAFGGSRVYTLYEGVTAIQRGTYLVVQDMRAVEHRYWSPYDFDTVWTVDRRATVDEFAALFTEAMRAHLTGNEGCWSLLSGGLDSSSIVSMAGWLASTDPTIPKLTGTITFVDTLGIGDERAYSDAVIRDWPVRNEQLIDSRPWEETEAIPFVADGPEGCSTLASDQMICRLVCSTGGRILFHGVGPDHYLHGDHSYFTDWIAKGRIRDCAREMYSEAVRNRASFWKLAYSRGVKAFMERESRSIDRWPEWVHPSFARRFPLEERASLYTQRKGTAGRRFATHNANNVANFDFAVSRGIVGGTLDVRYPFLHRPLVELCLRLPPEMKVTDGFHKWILREAMRGILPEVVRQRTSKGFVNGAIERSYTLQHARLDAMLSQSILGEMGCIDVGLARQALADRVNRQGSTSTNLECLLHLEAWLAMRSGRWDFRETAVSVQ
jgi:asparagine synthase (glutamine-hydrolysing)